MTDGRLAGHWVGDPLFDDMSVDAWCVFTKAVTWSNERGTDGLVPARYLSLLHPAGHCQPACDELTRLGLWAPVNGGYQMNDWSGDTRSGGLGQETAARVREQRDRRKRKQQAYRDRQKGTQVAMTTSDVTGNGDGNEAGNVGQDEDEDRTGRGQANYSEATDNSADVNTAPCCGEVHGPMEPCPRTDGPRLFGSLTDEEREAARRGELPGVSQRERDRRAAAA